ncbi:hypothetical protein PO883_21830 [Massilia sp. DJPM01]|uniref:hypothetical protein n=1 Tax=Massilia sp. DJPM01 TaxID=3024404 RepID=UPI00259DE90D|nr:hypothetical protein [Massilia sp. DJPM01]MDM5179834.1 hypothetical protein [Massilia sp. DJPM01]
MKTKQFIWAICLTVVATFASWGNMFESSSNWGGRSGGGSSWSSGSGSYGGSSGGGHK